MTHRQQHPQRTAESSRRGGMVLLFVVVLLTLLAVLGSVYLMTARIDAGQISNEARGGEQDTYGIEAANRVSQVMSETARAAQLQIFLDAFGRASASPGGAFPTASRSVEGLLWRPAEPVQSVAFAAAAATPASQATFGGFTPQAYSDAPLMLHPYYHVDAEGGTDPHLASRLPHFDPTVEIGLPQTGSYLWPWISAPLAGLPDFPVDNAFVSPFGGAGQWVHLEDPSALATSDFRRANVIPTSIGPAAYEAPSEVQAFTGTNPEFYNDRLRIYPALAFDINGNGDYTDAEDVVLPAADASGDGVADAGLVPVVFNADLPPPWERGGSLDRYIDPETGYAFFVVMRIVDNNAAANVNTAVRRLGDRLLPPAGDPTVFNPRTADFDTEFDATLAPATAAPNFGIFRSNVGAYELFAPGDPTAGKGELRAIQYQNLYRSFLGAPLSDTAPQLELAETVHNGAGTPLTEVRFDSLGELIEFRVARNLDSPFRLTPVTTPDALIQPRPYRTSAEAASLAYNGGGWLIPNTSPTRVEQVASDAMVFAAGNYVPNRSLQFSKFPLYGDMGLADPAETENMLRTLWATLFKFADPDARELMEAMNPPFMTVPLLADFRGKTMGATDMPLSPRAGLVTRNGVDMSFRPKVLNPLVMATAVEGYAADGLVPFGMPAYSAVDPLMRKRDPTLVGGGVVPPVRASLNSAPFAELWRAYWNVMDATTLPVDPTDPTATPLFANVPADPTTGLPNAMFSTAVYRELAVLQSNYEVLLLRSALAAVNTMDLRDHEIVHRGTVTFDPDFQRYDQGDADITIAEVSIDRTGLGPAGIAGPVARVYGTEAQPFVTEVLAHYEEGVMDFLAVELMNPYPFPIKMRGWKLMALDRGDPALAARGHVELLNLGTGVRPAPGSVDPSNPAEEPGAVWIPAARFEAGMYIPGYVVIQSSEEQRVALGYADPPAAEVAAGHVIVITLNDPTLPAPNVPFEIQEIDMADRELVLFRPAINEQDPAAVPLTPAEVVEGPGAAGTSLERFRTNPDPRLEYIPLDGIDMTGVDPTAFAEPVYFRYSRHTGNDPAATGIVVPDVRAWRFTWHGLYNPEILPSSGDEARSTGYVWADRPLPPADERLALQVPVEQMTGALGAPNGVATVVDTLSLVPPSIQLGPVVLGPITAPGEFIPSYPYGGFARDGDALAVPYIGGYRIFDAATETILAMNHVALDAFFADDLMIPGDQEDVGRFSPREHESYAWSRALLEYVTASYAPGWNVFPHVDPRYADPTHLTLMGGADPTLNATGAGQGAFFGRYDYITPGERMFEDPATTFAGMPDLPDLYDLSFQPVEGLINILNAPMGTLKLLPLMTNPLTGQLDALAGPETTLAAQELMIERRTLPMTGPTGPFIQTGPGTWVPLDSLLRLPRVGESLALATPTTFNTPTDSISQPGGGDISGRIQKALGVVPGTERAQALLDLNYYDYQYVAPGGTLLPTTPDWEAVYHQTIRLSNLSTLRSDSYTVYIVVQAWENLGTPQARIVRQQRTAFIVDRSGIKPFNPATGNAWTPTDIVDGTWETAFEGRITPVPVD